MVYRSLFALVFLVGCGTRVGGDPFSVDEVTDSDPPASDGDPKAGDDLPDSDGDVPQPLVIDPYSSLIVNDRFAFARVEDDFPIGKLMLDIAVFVEEQTVLWNATHLEQRELHDRDEFALHPWNGGSRDTERHNAYAGVKHGVTEVIRDSNYEMVLNPKGEKKWLPTVDPRGPFRMLAVVNRLDLAGDWDRRTGGHFAGEERRWFGEGRLVYGLTRDIGDKPYPMTFIAEYRLPALTKDADGRVVIDQDFDYVAGPSSKTAWMEGRKLWADLWAELSRFERSTPEYREKLRDIVALFAIGAHSVGVRSGERVQTEAGVVTDEFEYREHYMNDNWMLANRKVRREPFRCAEMSSVLADRVEADWDEEAGQLVYDYLLGDRNLDDPEIGEIAGLCGGEMPYGQGEADGGPPYQLRAKFVRFSLGEVWRTLLDEPKRHAFAIGTCTGCHAAETDTQGFVIGPRLADEDAPLARFLTGGAQFTSNGVTYTYDELSRRRVLLERFIALEDVEAALLTFGHE